MAMVGMYPFTLCDAIVVATRLPSSWFFSSYLTLNFTEIVIHNLCEMHPVNFLRDFPNFEYILYPFSHLFCCTHMMQYELPYRQWIYRLILADHPMLSCLTKQSCSKVYMGSKDQICCTSFL